MNATSKSRNGDCSAFSFGPDSDGNSGNNNALILSLYLIDSEDDLLHDSSQPSDNSSDNRHVRERARLYRRLCKACDIANGVLLSSSSTREDDDNLRADRKQSNPKTNYRPWSSGGDGPMFGIHCDINSDEYFIDATNDIDGDDMWQSQSPPNHRPTNSLDDSACRQMDTRKMKNNHQCQRQQPHLRAICRYGNDVNDMWRCVALVLRISSVLSSSQSEDQHNLTCAIECWDMHDGHVLLIEAAECLPSWVDDDALQGGVGGPAGCRNRCWVVDGKVHLIPPSKGDSAQNCNSLESMLLSRDSALFILMQSIKMNEKGSRTTAASGAMQRAIQNRIDRTDYSHIRTKNDSVGAIVATHPTSNPHWHIAATAMPASVARLIQNIPSLVPMLVDSFCANAPELQRKAFEAKDSKGATDDMNGDETLDGKSALPVKLQPENNATTNSSPNPLGNSFPYEQIVIIPVVFTRTNYAELVTGRGIVPSFPIPSAYRSVELNRFQRHLRQSAFLGDSFADEGGAKRRMRNPFERAVDVGIRLCAGLDWILSITDHRKVSDSMLNPVFNLEDSAIDTLGEVDRRLRVYWTRIDAEASGRGEQSDESLPWIEQAWQVGPNGSGIQNAEFDTTLLQALELMSKCQVFNPELCQPLQRAPCPCTRPGVSLLKMVQSGIKSALKWQRQDFDEDSFPMPNVAEMDDDVWMEVNSLEELEEEMKTLSSSRKVNRDSDATTESGRPRRTTRRSRVGSKFSHASCKEDKQDAQPRGDAEALNKMLTGFREFVEGEGDLEGAVTTSVIESPQHSESRRRNSSELDPEHGMSQEVNIDPRKFLNTLHSMLSSQRPQPESHPDESHDHISKFFFQEDLDDGHMSDDSERSSGDNIDKDTDNHGSGEDYWSIQNYMVSDKKKQDIRFDLPTCSN